MIWISTVGAVVRDTDAEIYLQVTAASQLGFETAVYQLRMDIDAYRVDAAESILRKFVQGGSLPGFPTMYGHRHSSGTFPPQAADCISFLGHIGLLSFGAMPSNMKELVEQWVPRSRRIDTLLPMPYMISYSHLMNHICMTLDPSQVRSMTVPAGQLLLEESSHNSEIMFVVQGACSMSVRGTTIGCLGPGHFFGETQFLVPGLARETVTAETPVFAVAMNKVALMINIQSKAALYLYFLARTLDIHISAVYCINYVEVIDALREFGHIMASRAGITLPPWVFSALQPISPL